MPKDAYSLFVDEADSDECFNPLHALDERNKIFLEGLGMGMNGYPVIRDIGQRNSVYDKMLVLTNFLSFYLGLLILTQYF